MNLNRVSIRLISTKEANIKKTTSKRGRKKQKAPYGGSVLATFVKTMHMVRDDLKVAGDGKITFKVVGEGSTKDVIVRRKFLKKLTLRLCGRKFKFLLLRISMVYRLGG